MPRRRIDKAPTYLELWQATGLPKPLYAELMQSHLTTVYDKIYLGHIRREPYAELALLHADAHPYYKLVKREQP